MAKEKRALTEKEKVKLLKEEEGYYKKQAAQLEKANPTEAGALYAQMGLKYDNKGYTKKAKYIKDKLTADGDYQGAAYVSSFVDKEATGKYGDALAKTGRWGDAGIAYFLAGKYNKAEEMVAYATKKGQKTKAIAILKAMVQRELQQAGLADKYEKKGTKEEVDEEKEEGEYKQAA